MKSVDFLECFIDYNSLLLVVWKMFHFSHEGASQRVLDCSKELVETIDHICLETKKLISENIKIC